MARRTHSGLITDRMIYDPHYAEHQAADNEVLRGDMDKLRTIAQKLRDVAAGHPGVGGQLIELADKLETTTEHVAFFADVYLEEEAAECNDDSTSDAPTDPLS